MADVVFSEFEMTQDPATRNVEAVAQLEQNERLRRTVTERAIDRLARWAGHPSFPLVHLIWFAAWIGLNSWSARPFDPYPFTFLTLVVSLEAILLTSFVLAAQDRMTREADRRAKLDLQIDMLAEQELTAILRSVGALADHSGVDLTGVVPNLPELTSDTRIDRLARRLADADDASASESHTMKLRGALARNGRGRNATR
jgi:uncharacterized membrane protein